MKKVVFAMMMLVTVVLSGCNVTEKEYQACMKEKEELTKQFEDKNIEFFNQLQMVTNMAADMEVQHKATYDQLQEVEKQLAEAKDQNTTLQKKARGALEQFIKAQAEVGKLKDQLDQSRTAMVKTADLMKQVEQQNQQLEKENQQLKEQLNTPK